MATARLVILLGALGALSSVASCSQGEAKVVCSPGIFAYCLCSDGESGTQECAEDGTEYGACNCNGEIPGGGSTASPVRIADGGPTGRTDREGTPGEPGGGTSGRPNPGGNNPGGGNPGGNNSGPTAACPGTTVDVSGDLQLEGDTRGSPTGSVGDDACNGAVGPEVVYRVRSDVDGQLSASIATDGWQPYVYARSGACVSGRSVCGDGGGTTRVLIPITADGAVSLFVDSGGDQGGGFVLTLHVEPNP